MVLICNSPDKADRLLAGLQIAADDPLAAVSATRLATLLPQSAALDWDAVQADARYLAATLLLQALLS